jgi:hypothetical protein
MEEAKLEITSDLVQDKIPTKFSRVFGCGYPGDPKTKEWL